MKRAVFLIPLVIVLGLAVVLLRAVTSGADPAAIATPLAGKPAPALDIALLDEGGRRLALADIRGKPALVNFFASWCGPCAEENTLLLELAVKDHAAIYGVAMKDDAGALKAYLDRRGNPYRQVGLDDTGQTAIAWGVSGVPETFLLDARGNILERHTGALDAGDAQRFLDLMRKAS